MLSVSANSEDCVSLERIFKSHWAVIASAGCSSMVSEDVALNQMKPGCMVMDMARSARNQLRGQVKNVKLGNEMAHIVVQVGDNESKSIITRRSADEMHRKAGDDVTVVIRSTQVMIQKWPCGG